MFPNPFVFEAEGVLRRVCVVGEVLEWRVGYRVVRYSIKQPSLIDYELPESQTSPAK